MPVLKWRDPADGLWKPVPVGGSAAAAPAAGAGLTGGVTSYEVGAGTGVVVAADTVALDTAYTDTLYSPLTHGHALNDLTDADTAASAPAVGDSLVFDGTAWVPSGPAVSTPPSPTLVTHAARWADGIPSFVDAAVRDAAYTAIGGPVTGMVCYLLSFKRQEIWNGTGWAPSPSSAVGEAGWTSTAPMGAFASGWSTLPFTAIRGRHTDLFTLSGGMVKFTVPGLYRIDVSMRFATGTAATISVAIGYDLTTAPANSFIGTSKGQSDPNVTGARLWNANPASGMNIGLWVNTTGTDVFFHPLPSQIFFTYLGQWP